MNLLGIPFSCKLKSNIFNLGPFGGTHGVAFRL